MYIDNQTLDYVPFTDVTPKRIEDGLRQMVTARLAIIAERAPVGGTLRGKLFTALTALMDQQHTRLLQADKNDAGLPKIEQWWFARRLNEPFIIVAGEVSGHPILPDGFIYTSPLYHWEVDRSLIATQNTIYRVGQKFDLSLALAGQ
jgi:hypothetical protein